MSWPVPGRAPEPGKDGCPWVMGEEGILCGLLSGHAGGHLPFVPGGYLPAPILHPVDWLLVRVRGKSGTRLCPNGCSPLRILRTMFGPYISDLSHVDFETSQWHYLDDEVPHVEVQTTLRFSPCGCEFRAIHQGHHWTPEGESDA